MIAEECSLALGFGKVTLGTDVVLMHISGMYVVMRATQPKCRNSIPRKMLAGDDITR